MKLNNGKDIYLHELLSNDANNVIGGQGITEYGGIVIPPDDPLMRAFTSALLGYDPYGDVDVPLRTALTHMD